MLAIFTNDNQSNRHFPSEMRMGYPVLEKHNAYFAI